MSSTTTSTSATTATLLSLIKVVLDDNGAWNWNYRIVGIVSAVTLLAIKCTCHKAYGIDWYSQVNAIVTGVGAVVICYLDYFASEEMTGVPEPLRSAQCEGPLTSLHRILPAIAMGYAVIDVVDGFTYGIDFFLHGLATLSVMMFFCEQDRPQFVAPFLIMECSTIFLNLRKATFLGDAGSAAVQILFAVFFTLCRILIVPPIHFNMTRTLFRMTPEVNDCDAPYFKWAVLFFGTFFHCLNGFWFYKLIQKIIRKASGKEKIRDKLSLQSTTKTE